MNAKTQAQINRMKEQTIGVEVEMNNITRKAAAKLAAEFFGTNRSEYTAHRNGYETYSAWDAQEREWKFQRDCSISGSDSEKCELVTPILHYADIETLQELIRRLRKAGAKSDYTRGCGVHIHIGAAGHTPQSLRNLANLMASHETLIAEAIKVDSSRMNRYCRTVNPNFLQQLNKKKPTTMAQLADIWYGAQGCDYGRTHHYNDSRYHMLYVQYKNYAEKFLLGSHFEYSQQKILSIKFYSPLRNAFISGSSFQSGISGVFIFLSIVSNALRRASGLALAYIWVVSMDSCPRKSRI